MENPILRWNSWSFFLLARHLDAFMRRAARQCAAQAQKGRVRPFNRSFRRHDLHRR